MKLAISARGQNLESSIEPLKDRIKSLLIYDSDTGETKTISTNGTIVSKYGFDNGIVEELCAEGVEFIFTQVCEKELHRRIDKTEIAVIEGLRGSAKEAVESFLTGSLFSSFGNGNSTAAIVRPEKAVVTTG